MLATLFGLALLAPQVEKAPRLKATLPNGAMVLVQRVADAKNVRVSLIVSLLDRRATVETHGRIHLLEHVLAKGRNHDLDARLELKGCFISANTTRDALTFSIDCDRKDIGFAMSAIQETLKRPEATPEELAKEVKVMAQELLYLEPDSSFSSEAWKLAYVENGFDALGSTEALGKATLEDLWAEHAARFRGPNIVAVISGPIDVDEALSLMKPWVGQIAAGQAVPPDPRRPAGKPGESVNDKGFGELRGAIVNGLADPDTLAVLAAGMALVSAHPDWRIVYTPSIQSGLVLLHSVTKNELGPIVDLMNDEDLHRYWQIGKALLPLWLRSAESDSHLRALLMRQDVNLTPEKLLSQAETLDFSQFKKGIEAFRRGKAAVVVGK